jgi:hypothetical protein
MHSFAAPEFRWFLSGSSPMLSPAALRAFVVNRLANLPPRIYNQ